MTNTPRIIGVCLSMLPEEYRLQCVRALNKYAVQQGYRLFIFHSKTDFYLPLTPTDDGEMSIFQMIQYHMLDAMIVLRTPSNGTACCKASSTAAAATMSPLSQLISFWKAVSTSGSTILTLLKRSVSTLCRSTMPSGSL